ncbi:MAG: hypothetical protein HOQ32_06970 [Lysobacter sp.]|nr:hypothetical protein [Lysobacter sp.]
MRPSLAATLSLLLCLPCAYVSAQTAKPLDDPRPNGYLSLRERSLCEPSDAHPTWCEQPHEVRRFLNRYDECEHWRGEEAPSGDKARAAEITKGADSACTGNDHRLTELRRRYRNQPAVVDALSKLELNYGP